MSERRLKACQFSQVWLVTSKGVDRQSKKIVHQTCMTPDVLSHDSISSESARSISSFLETRKKLALALSSISDKLKESTYTLALEFSGYPAAARVTGYARPSLGTPSGARFFTQRKADVYTRMSKTLPREDRRRHCGCSFRRIVLFCPMKSYNCISSTQRVQCWSIICEA